MIKRLWRWLWPADASQTLPRHDASAISEERLAELLEEHMREITFEWNEWYEKFDKLHLRLAKRADRESKKRLGNGAPPEQDHGGPISVLPHRKFGSV